MTRLAAICAALIALCGCQLQPLYAGGSAGPVATTLSSVTVAPIEGQAGSAPNAQRGRDLVLNFQRFRFDMDRLLSVHTRRSVLGLVLRRSRSGHPQDQHSGKAVIRNS